MQFVTYLPNEFIFKTASDFEGLGLKSPLIFPVELCHNGGSRCRDTQQASSHLRHLDRIECDYYVAWIILRNMHIVLQPTSNTTTINQVLHPPIEYSASYCVCWGLVADITCLWIYSLYFIGTVVNAASFMHFSGSLIFPAGRRMISKINVD